MTKTRQPVGCGRRSSSGLSKRDGSSTRSLASTYALFKELEAAFASPFSLFIFCATCSGRYKVFDIVYVSLQQGLDFFSREREAPYLSHRHFVLFPVFNSTACKSIGNHFLLLFKFLIHVLCPIDNIHYKLSLYSPCRSDVIGPPSAHSSHVF